MREHGILARYRGHPERWDELACMIADSGNLPARGDKPAAAEGEEISPAEGEGEFDDLHAAERYRVLIALQRDLQLDHDGPLVAYLFDQEAERAERLDAFPDSLDLAAYLLATFRDPANMWRFWRAKGASFDTFCGLAADYLISAGVEETLAELRLSPDQAEAARVRGELPAYVDGPAASEALADWWEAKRGQYPADERDEAWPQRIERAMELGEREEAARLLEAWLAEAGRTPGVLRLAADYHEKLGRLEQAIAAQRNYLATPGDAFLRFPGIRASAQLRLARLLLEVGRPAEAWQALSVAVDTLQAHQEGWTQLGFGRSALEIAVSVAEAVPPGDPLAGVAVGWGDRYLEGRGSAPDDLRRTAAALAGRHRPE